jgi:hypothetical protein
MEEAFGIVCVDCRALAPETETAYTLIGQAHGWRLTFRQNAQGERIPEWRCPECFKRVKERSAH